MNSWQKFQMKPTIYNAQDLLALLTDRRRVTPLFIIAVNCGVSSSKLSRFLSGKDGTKITLEEGLRLTQYLTGKPTL